LIYLGQGKNNDSFHAYYNPFAVDIALSNSLQSRIQILEGAGRILPKEFLEK
tara:strand:- start:1280 stop:1435 length:156 start_codon:yes stop_codon:yes gene_type:complete